MEILVVAAPGLFASWPAWPWRAKVLPLAVLVLVVELALRRLAPRSRAYLVWTAFFLAVGSLWTAILLSIVYFVSVALISVLMKAFGKDPLDRGLDPEASFWRAHEPNPLGPLAAARHQF